MDAIATESENEEIWSVRHGSLILFVSNELKL